MTEELPQISDREREILKLVATGATNQQIAHDLDISINTVKVHLRNIFGKIGVTSRTEATVYAIRLGLVEVAEEAVQEESQSVETTPVALPATLTVEMDRDEPLLLPPTGDTPTNALALHPQKDAVVVPPVVPHSSLLHSPSRRHTTLLVGLILVIVGLAATLALVLFRQPTAMQAVTPVLPVGTTTVAPTETEANRWSLRAAMQEPRTGFAVATYEYDQKIYVIGGSDANGPTSNVQRYDPQNNLWVQMNDKPTAVSHVRAVTLGGAIYVPGGETANGAVSRVFERYDPRSQQWKTLPDLPMPRSRYALVSFEGRLYLFGGWDGKQTCTEVFIYDPADDDWTQGPPMPTPRQAPGAAVVGGVIYIIGGENKNEPLQVNEFYDPTREEKGVWGSAVPLPNPIAAPAVVNVINALLVFDPQKRQAVQYNPSTDSWVTMSVPDDVALSDQAVAVGGSVFVFGTSGGGESPQTVSLSEYRALYTTFIPSVIGQ